MTDAFIGGFDNFRREFQTYVGAELFKVVLGVISSQSVVISDQFF